LGVGGLRVGRGLRGEGDEPAAEVRCRHRWA
jgi:hypothetical protein